MSYGGGVVVGRFRANRAEASGYYQAPGARVLQLPKPVEFPYALRSVRPGVRVGVPVPRMWGV